MSEQTESVYRSLFIVEVFTVGPFDPYAEMDHYDGEDAHVAEGRDLSEILSDTYEHGIPTRYYQIAAHPVPDSALGEWAEMAREHANVAEMSYGYRDGAPYGLGGEEPIESVTGVIDLVDLWQFRNRVRGGSLRTCVCSYPITVFNGQWEHLFNETVVSVSPAPHEAEPV